jgi:hypothetical protein
MEELLQAYKKEKRALETVTQLDDIGQLQLGHKYISQVLATLGPGVAQVEAEHRNLSLIFQRPIGLCRAIPHDAPRSLFTAAADLMDAVVYDTIDECVDAGQPRVQRPACRQPILSLSRLHALRTAIYCLNVG